MATGYWKRLVAALLSALLLTALPFVAGEARADTRIRLLAQVEPALPQVGQEFELRVKVLDGRGQPLARGIVAAAATMLPGENPAMAPHDAEGSPASPHRFFAQATEVAGEYRLRGRLDMPGRWQLQVWGSGGGASGKITAEIKVLEAAPPSGLSVPLLALVAASMSGAAWARRRAAGQDLLRWRLAAGLLRSRLYPGVLQAMTGVAFGVILYFLLFGSAVPHDNLGLTMTWIVWWPLLPLLILLFGRAWCAVCPMSAASDGVQRLWGRRRPVPRWLRRWGPWAVFGSFLAITWVDAVFGLVEVPRTSAALLLLVSGGVLASGLLWERRAWCRYLCPIGGLIGNYAAVSALELRGRPGPCGACHSFECVRGGAAAAGCPMFEFPKTMASSRHCNLCAQCVKSCPHQSLRLSLRAPGQGLASEGRADIPQAVTAVALLGLVAYQTLIMLQPWPEALARLQATTGASAAVLTSVAFLLVVGGTGGALGLLCPVGARWSSRPAKEVFTQASLSLIPLGLFAHLAHNLNHLLGEGLLVVANVLALLGQPYHRGVALVSLETIHALQYLLVIVGLALTLRMAWRRAGTSWRRPLGVLIPAPGLALLFAGVALGLFSLGMMPRGQMNDSHDLAPGQIEAAKKAVPAFAGRELPLEFVHLEEHGYRDIILRSGPWYYFVDSATNLVVSMFSSQPRQGKGPSLSRDWAHQIAVAFAATRYPGFAEMGFTELTEELTNRAFPGSHVFEWRQLVDGVPTPNHVKMTLDAWGEVAIYSARRVVVVVSPQPQVIQEAAITLAQERLPFAAQAEATTLDIGVDLTGAQLLRWTVRLVEKDVALEGRPRRAEVVIDAHRGQTISVVEWR